MFKAQYENLGWLENLYTHFPSIFSANLIRCLTLSPKGISFKSDGFVGSPYHQEIMWEMLMWRGKVSDIHL